MPYPSESLLRILTTLRTYVIHNFHTYYILHLAREKKWTATMFYSSVKSFFNWRMPFYVNLRTASIITKISGGMIK